MTSPRISGRPRRLPLLLQAEAAECGLACLAMIASFHGHEIDLNEMRHRFRVSLKGTTLKALVHFARTLGLSARALRLEPEALGRLQCPAILHLDMNHFVVLRETRGSLAVIHDPALGLRRLAAADLDRRFTGIALELAPGVSFARRRPAPRLTLAMLAGPIEGGGELLAKALLLSVALQLLVLAAPLYVQLVIDRAVAQGEAEVLLSLALGFATLIGLRAAVGWLRAQLLLAAGGRLSAQLMANVVRHMLRLAPAWFERRHVSSLLSRVNSTQPVKDLIAEGLVGAVVDGLMAVLTIVAALLFAPGLALVVLAGFGASALLKWWHVRRSMARDYEYIEALAKSQQEFIETVRGIAGVKLFGKEADREARWNDRHIDAVNAKYSVDSIKARADLGRETIQGLALAAIVYVGARQAIEGEASLGTLMAFITYQAMFFAASSNLLDFAGRFKLLNVHLQRLGDVVLSQTEDDRPGETCAAGLAGRLTVERVGFRYGEFEDAVLTNVSLDVEPGAFVAITGASGCGKTTLLKVMIGLLEPTGGSVRYDGRSIRSIGLVPVRAQIGVVMQEEVVLSGSIAQNITFFDASPDLDRMREAARLAAIDEDIKGLPMGYETLVGDMGSVLSGGQKQRLFLARALYRAPKILFVDEGTSSLDPEKEREVNRNMAGLNMTRIVIAHRRETIAAADRIYELTADGLALRRP